MLLIILLLAGYIVFLHIKLIRRDVQIDSLLKKFSGYTEPLRPEDRINEKIFSENVQNFMLEYLHKARIYLHYTRFKSDAENIIKEGFRFIDSFHKTTILVTGDRLDLMIKHNSKRYFGDFIVVICISEKIIKYYNDVIARAGIKNCHFENILTEYPPEKNENADTVYLLPSKYVKGIINYKSGEITVNPDFDPEYSSPWFEQNLERLKP